MHVERDRHAAGLEDAEVGDQELRDVGQLQGHHVAGPDPGRLQPGSQPVGQRVQLGVAELAARVHGDGPVRRRERRLPEDDREIEVHGPAPPRAARPWREHARRRAGYRRTMRATGTGPPREQPPVQDQRPCNGRGYRRERRHGPGEPGPLIPAWDGRPARATGVVPFLAGTLGTRCRRSGAARGLGRHGRGPPRRRRPSGAAAGRAEPFADLGRTGLRGFQLRHMAHAGQHHERPGRVGARHRPGRRDRDQPVQPCRAGRRTGHRTDVDRTPVGAARRCSPAVATTERAASVKSRSASLKPPRLPRHLTCCATTSGLTRDGSAQTAARTRPRARPGRTGGGG